MDELRFVGGGGARRARRGATLVEVLLAGALVVGVLLFVIEAARWFTARGVKTGESMQRARELGLLGERLRRLLKLTHAVERLPGAPPSYRFHVLRWRGEAWELEPVELRVLEGGQLELVVPGEGSRRYSLGRGFGTLGASTAGGAIVLRLGEGEGATELRVHPLVPARDPAVLEDGEGADPEAWLQALNETPWVESSGEGPPDLGPGKPLAAGGGRAFVAVEGEVPGGSGPVRSDLFTEASVLAPEVSLDGRALLPLAPPGEGPRLDAYAATRTLMARGYDAEEASFLAVMLAATELPDRFLRAAGLAAWARALAGSTPAERWRLAAELHPERFGDAEPPDLDPDDVPPVHFDDSLLRGARPEDDEQAHRPPPAGFGGVPLGEGRAPDWDDWFSTLGGVPRTPALEALLPARAAARLAALGLEAPRADELGDVLGPEVGLPGDVFPVGQGGDGDDTRDLARAPDLASTAEAFEEAKNTRDARRDQRDAAQTALERRQAELAQSTQAMQQAQAEVASVDRDLTRAQELLAWRENHLAQLNREHDGNCSCPETRANIVRSNQEIAALQKDLRKARSALGQATAARDEAQQRTDVAQAERDQRQEALEQARQDLSAAREAFRSASDSFQDG